ncbi:helix-turn-helix domain-containing protein [Providencia sp. SP181]|uniref:helix-turn-helix domain-containing protein n=1 Tax=Providencia sp. SP181 TaxID=3136277 RepID=UPI003D2992F9
MPKDDELSLYQYSSLSSLTGRYLKRQRRNNCLSGKALAKLMNLSQQQISRYERGMTQFNLDTLFQFFYVLNIPTQEKLFYFELVTTWHEEKHAQKQIHVHNNFMY